MEIVVEFVTQKDSCEAPPTPPTLLMEFKIIKHSFNIHGCLGNVFGFILLNGSIIDFIENSYELDFTFMANRSLTQLSTNIVYHQVIGRY